MHVGCKEGESHLHAFDDAFPGLVAGEQCQMQAKVIELDLRVDKDEIVEIPLI